MGTFNFTQNVTCDETIQTDQYMQQDSISAQLIDQPWDDDAPAGWLLLVFVGVGIVNTTQTEGQLYISAGNAAGVDSVALAQKTLTAPNPITTTEFKIKFDVLGTGFDGSAASYDIVSYNQYTGLYNVSIIFSLDSVWFYDSTNNYVKQFDYTFDNTSWYTFRIIINQNEVEIWMKDDDADWAFLGCCDDADPNTGNGGLVQFVVFNYPTSPATTQCHVDYLKVTTGAFPPR